MNMGFIGFLVVMLVAILFACVMLINIQGILIDIKKSIDKDHLK